jgi:hypothetical protein
MERLLPLGEGKGEVALTLAREGRGRLWYRLALRHAPASLHLEPLSQGLRVERRYEAVDDPGDVCRRADGAWLVRAGARVEVTLTLIAEVPRGHVLLADPFPASFSALAPEPALPLEEATWYDRERRFDDRLEVYAPLLPAGGYTYGYVARAALSGTFVVPPPTAEAQFEPEVRGRGASAVVVVK